MAQADAAANDSIAMTLYADAAKAGYKSGNRAKAELGIRLYQEGKYAEALEYLLELWLWWLGSAIIRRGTVPVRARSIS